MRARGPSTDATRQVSATQALLQRLYAIEAPHPATAFLLDDTELARHLHGDGFPSTDEMLLVQEHEDGLDLSLYLDRALLERLRDAPPHENLGLHNLADFWALVEGVSHFIYLTWNAARKRSVTPMELELQGEVDKYAASILVWQRQSGGAPRGLHRLLFETAQVPAGLAPALQERYRDANRYAGRYCQVIEREYLHRKRDGLVGELRAFYRENRGGKLARIGQP